MIGNFADVRMLEEAYKNIKWAIQKLIEIQKKKNYTETKMAALLDVHLATYNRWIKGKTITKKYAHINNIIGLLEKE